MCLIAANPPLKPLLLLLCTVQVSTRAKRTDNVWCATPCTMLRIVQVCLGGWGSTALQSNTVVVGGCC